MSMEPGEAFVLTLGGVGLLWYYVCLFAIGLLKVENNAPLRDFMALSITTISVSLATFVGMLLGLRGIGEEVSRAADTVHASSTRSVVAMSADKLQEVAASAAGSNLQWTAAILYIVSLLVALGLWSWKRDQTHPAIANLARSLLGLVGGALSVLLNVPRG